MLRESKATGWRCGHLHPLIITTLNDKRRARCTYCGTLGPVCQGLAEAMLTLRSVQSPARELSDSGTH